MTRGWLRLAELTGEVLVRATGLVSLLERPAAPMTPAGRWLVLAVLTGLSSPSFLGKIFLGGVGTLSPAFAIFFTPGPARFGLPASQLSSAICSKELRGLTLI